MNVEEVDDDDKSYHFSDEDCENCGED